MIRTEDLRARKRNLTSTHKCNFNAQFGQRFDVVQTSSERGSNDVETDEWGNVLRDNNTPRDDECTNCRQALNLGPAAKTRRNQHVVRQLQRRDAPPDDQPRQKRGLSVRHLSRRRVVTLSLRADDD
jgi:hypothetical protein